MHLNNNHPAGNTGTQAPKSPKRGIVRGTKKWGSDSGFSILELVAVMVISTIIFSATYFVLSSFAVRFEQLSKIARLNEEAYDCIMTIKHGLAVEEDQGGAFQFLGLTNANRMSLIGNSEQVQLGTGQYISGTTGVFFKPPKNSEVYSVRDSITISLNNRGFVEYDANAHGIDNYLASNVRIFPKLDDSDMKVEDLLFSPVTDIYNLANVSDTNIDIVRVYLKASIDLGNSSGGLFMPYENPYFVEYETFIAIEQGLD